MAISLDEFWGSNYYNHPPLTDEMIGIAESQLGVRLPGDYIALLRSQNGGYTRGFAHPTTLPTTWATDHVPLNDLAGIVIDTSIRTAQNLLDTAYMTEEWGLPPRQALLSGDGHWWITLDYRKSETPSVAWIDVECTEEMQVAPTFTAFLQGLVPESEFDQEEA